MAMTPGPTDESSGTASESGSPPRNNPPQEESGVEEPENNEIVVEDSNDGDDEDEGDEVYIVEKIQAHTQDEDGNWALLVKWQGYDKKTDRTWEPEENLLEGASDILKEYWNSIGGHPSKQIKKRKRLSAAAGQQKRGRKSATESEAATPDPPRANGQGSSSSRARLAHRNTREEVREARPKRWVPPSKSSWEDDVMAVDTVEEAHDGKGQKIRLAYLAWNNGERSSHLLSVANQKCPQKMLSYYEQHLVFKTTVSTYDPYRNGHDSELPDGQ